MLTYLLIAVLMLKSLNIVTTSYTRFPCDQEDYDDCNEAVYISDQAKRACDSSNETIELCRNDVLQLKRRFAAMFQTDIDYDKNCNPCNTGGPCPNRGTPVVDEICNQRAKDTKQVTEHVHTEIDHMNVTKILPQFYWHQDENIWNDKSRSCCVTTKRTVPFLWKCGFNCYVVFCPFSGGYQWVDQVKCNILTKKDKKLYGAAVDSRGKCSTPCEKFWTWRAYLVTNVPPQGWFGHCFHWWLPVWFKMIQVPTHCYCPDTTIPIY